MLDQAYKEQVFYDWALLLRTMNIHDETKEFQIENTRE
jgi:hypothetical protein